MSAGEWYKGSLHSHTTNSDGDASPIDVVMWYRDHGYDWLVISDHNKLTRVDTTPLESNSEKFLKPREPPMKELILFEYF